jgi:hypothetical protein
VTRFTYLLFASQLFLRRPVFFVFLSVRQLRQPSSPAILPSKKKNDIPTYTSPPPQLSITQKKNSKYYENYKSIRPEYYNKNPRIPLLTLSPALLSAWE